MAKHTQTIRWQFSESEFLNRQFKKPANVYASKDSRDWFSFFVRIRNSALVRFII